MAKAKSKVVIRKPPTITGEDFLAGREPGAAPGRTFGKNARRQRTTGTKELMRRLSVYMPEDVVKEFKVWCAKEELKFGDGLTRVVRAHLSR